MVKAQIIFWTAGFVLLTLLVNAPLLPRVLRWLSLNRIPDKQLRRRQRAIEALGEHTQEIIEELRDDEDELLSGRTSIVQLPIIRTGELFLCRAHSMRLDGLSGDQGRHLMCYGTCRTHQSMHDLFMSL